MNKELLKWVSQCTDKRSVDEKMKSVYVGENLVVATTGLQLLKVDYTVEEIGYVDAQYFDKVPSLENRPIFGTIDNIIRSDESGDNIELNDVIKDNDLDLLICKVIKEHKQNFVLKNFNVLKPGKSRFFSDLVLIPHSSNLIINGKINLVGEVCPFWYVCTPLISKY